MPAAYRAWRAQLATALGARSSLTALRRCAARARVPLVTRAAATDAAAPGKKLALITGANTGLGKQAALVLSRDHGFEVVGACRSLERGEAAAAAVAAAGGALSVLELDLASMASIRRFADEFKATYGRCDVLLANAGVMVRARRARCGRENYRTRACRACMWPRAQPHTRRAARPPGAADAHRDG